MPLLRTRGLDAKGRVGSGKQREATAPILPWQTASLVSEFPVEVLPSAELQPWFLHLQWGTCPWAEHSDDDFTC